MDYKLRSSSQAISRVMKNEILLASEHMTAAKFLSQDRGRALLAKLAEINK
jgi:hypothetical protein